MAGTGELKLLGFWSSSFVIRARIALKLKGLGYEYLEEVVGTKSDLLLESNPVYKKIPVLIHDGRPICESMIIVEYVDEIWATTGPSILPADPYDRAVARFWTAYIDDKLPPALRILVGVVEGNKEEAIEQIMTTLQLLEDVFKKQDKGNHFFFGDTIGYLDIAFGCYIGCIKAVEKMVGIQFLDEQNLPLLAEWTRRFCSDDAVIDSMPEADRLVEYFEQAVNARASTR